MQKLTSEQGMFQAITKLMNEQGTCEQTSVGQTAGSRVKKAELKFALSGQSLAHIRASLQACQKSRCGHFEKL